MLLTLDDYASSSQAPQGSWCLLSAGRKKQQRKAQGAAGTAAHCYALLHTATHCCTLLHTATHCYTLLHTATHCYTRLRAATHCYTLLHIATHCYTLLHTAMHCYTLLHTALNRQGSDVGSYADPRNFLGTAGHPEG
jgi:hypothetical protein